MNRPEQPWRFAAQPRRGSLRWVAEVAAAVFVIAATVALGLVARWVQR
jgi:hypothetical protein